MGSGHDGPVQPWTPEFPVSPARAAALIAGQFPALAGRSVRRLAQGWDNVAYLVDERWVFRFPQRGLAVDLLASEVRVLGWLGPLVPFATTAPTFVGAPTADSPAPFAGYPMLPGQTVCAAGLDAAARRALAAPLGRALAALHALDPDAAAAAGAPPDRIGRTEVHRYAELGRRRLVGHLGGPVAGVARRALRVLDDAHAALPWAADVVGAARRVVVHGDLYARHVVVEGGRLVGFIDWGDVHLGDPALDLSIAHALLPPAAHGAFRAAYGLIDAGTWGRARFRAAHYVSALLHYGWDVGDAALVAEAEVALRHLELVAG